METKEEFYGIADSCYLRVQFVEETDSFRIILRNEYLLARDTADEKSNLVGNIGRGMLELAYSNPQQTFAIGHNAGLRDMFEATSENLTEEQKTIWNTNPPSGAIN